MSNLQPLLKHKFVLKFDTYNQKTSILQQQRKTNILKILFYCNGEKSGVNQSALAKGLKHSKRQFNSVNLIIPVKTC